MDLILSSSNLPKFKTIPIFYNDSLFIVFVLLHLGLVWSYFDFIPFLKLLVAFQLSLLVKFFIPPGFAFFGKGCFLGYFTLKISQYIYNVYM